MRNPPLAVGILVTLAIIVLMLLIVRHPQGSNHLRRQQESQPPLPPPHAASSTSRPLSPPPKPVDVTVDFAGDCTFGTVNGDGGPGRFPTVFRQSHEKDYPFHLMHRWFDHDDLTVVNFECTLTNAKGLADKQWHFKGPASYAGILTAGGVDVAGIANNHSHDYLQAGFDDTLANFKKARIPTFYQNTPYVTRIKGVDIVLIADCTVVGENTTVIDGAPERVLGQIGKYKKPGNIVIVFMHWGSELDKSPRPWQVDLGHRFVDAGADAVVGAHPHVVQGIETYNGKTIAYSLGNFAFGGNSHARYPETFILRLKSHVVDGKAGPLAASIVPCWTTSSADGFVNNYRPQPVFGETAERVVGEVVDRSEALRDGVRTLTVARVTRENDDRQ